MSEVVASERGDGSSPAGRRLRVVIADDQLLVRAGFRMILAAQPDIEVIAEVSDGEEAIAACRRLRPDVILMDIRMPRLDGLEAVRRIMADSGRSEGSGPSAKPGQNEDPAVVVSSGCRVLISPPSTWTNTSTLRCRPAPAGSCSRTSRRSS